MQVVLWQGLGGANPVEAGLLEGEEGSPRFNTEEGEGNCSELLNEL